MEFETRKNDYLILKFNRKRTVPITIFLRALSATKLAERSVERAQQLVMADVIGNAELQRREVELSVARAELRAASDQLRLIGLPESMINRLRDTGALASEVAITVDEYKQFVEWSHDEAGGKLKLIHHAAFGTLAQNIAAVKVAEKAGAELVLLAYPHNFYATTEQHIFDYTKAFCDATRLGVILFPVPHWGFERVHPAGMSPELIKKMVREIPNIVCIKAEAGMPTPAGFVEAWKNHAHEVVVTSAHRSPAKTADYTANADAQVVDGNISLSDVDDTELAGAVATISSGFRPGDTLSYDTELASSLGISENTVKNHLRNILEKLQLRTRMEAALYAVRERLVDTAAREMGIDIAVDLKGITYEARGRLFAHRAAPIQVNYLGYPGTTGAAQVFTYG